MRRRLGVFKLYTSLTMTYTPKEDYRLWIIFGECGVCRSFRVRDLFSHLRRCVTVMIILSMTKRILLPSVVLEVNVLNGMWYFRFRTKRMRIYWFTTVRVCVFIFLCPKTTFQPDNPLRFSSVALFPKAFWISSMHFL